MSLNKPLVYFYTFWYLTMNLPVLRIAKHIDKIFLLQWFQNNDIILLGCKISNYHMAAAENNSCQIWPAIAAVGLTLGATMLLGNWLLFHHKTKAWNEGDTSLKGDNSFLLTLSWRGTWKVYSKISHSSLFVRSVEVRDERNKLDKLFM